MPARVPSSVEQKALTDDRMLSRICWVNTSVDMTESDTAVFGPPAIRFSGDRLDPVIGQEVQPGADADIDLAHRFLAKSAAAGDPG